MRGFRFGFCFRRLQSILSSMSTRKISISQLRKGMFIHELDIPWMQSPFLRHRRKITVDNDIVLLKKAGVRALYIDLARGDDVSSETSNNAPKQPQTSSPEVPDNPRPEKDESSEEPSANEESSTSSDANAVTLKTVSLKEELKVAKVLQGKIGQLVNQLGTMVKAGQAISIATITPVIDEAKDSLSRNDQALLTMLHLHRQDIKLSDHGFGVFAVVLPLAMRMGYTEEEINLLGMAALLHDTGWSRLPMHLFGKNKAYTATEKRLIEQHPNIVENVLNKSQDIPDAVKKLVSQHHELKDGQGYPGKLQGDEIFELVEILQVADFYDEYIHGLTDKPGMLPANALKLLYQSAKKGLYNEATISELIHVMGIYPLTSAVQLSSGEKALVVEIDKDKPLSPQVKIIYDKDGRQCISEKIIDLANKENSEQKVSGIIEPLDKREDPLGLLRVTSA